MVTVHPPLSRIFAVWPRTIRPLGNPRERERRRTEFQRSRLPPPLAQARKGRGDKEVYVVYLCAIESGVRKANPVSGLREREFAQEERQGFRSQLRRFSIIRDVSIIEQSRDNECGTYRVWRAPRRVERAVLPRERIPPPG